MAFLVKGVVEELRMYSGISKKTGHPYTNTLVTIGTYEFSFFNVPEGTIVLNMEIEFACVRKDRYYNAIPRTLRILRHSVYHFGTLTAEFRVITTQPKPE